MKNVDNSLHISAVISGSYRKHFDILLKLKKILVSMDIKVLSPHGNEAINPGEEFVFLDSDPIKHPRILQDAVFAKIRASTMLIVANINGYIGNAALIEIGYSISYNLQIYTIEKVLDPNIAPYCQPITNLAPDINWQSLLQINKLGAACNI